MPPRFDLVTLDSPATHELAGSGPRWLDLHEVEREDSDRWIVLADRDGVRRIGSSAARPEAGFDPSGPVVRAATIRRELSG